MHPFMISSEKAVAESKKLSLLLINNSCVPVLYVFCDEGKEPSRYTILPSREIKLNISDAEFPIQMKAYQSIDGNCIVENDNNIIYNKEIQLSDLTDETYTIRSVDEG